MTRRGDGGSAAHIAILVMARALACFTRRNTANSRLKSSSLRTGIPIDCTAASNTASPSARRGLGTCGNATAHGESQETLRGSRGAATALLRE